jgi:hypothetical protein
MIDYPMNQAANHMCLFSGQFLNGKSLQFISEKVYTTFSIGLDEVDPLSSSLMAAAIPWACRVILAVVNKQDIVSVCLRDNCYVHLKALLLIGLINSTSNYLFLFFISSFLHFLHFLCFFISSFLHFFISSFLHFFISSFQGVLN